MEVVVCQTIDDGYFGYNQSDNSDTYRFILYVIEDNSGPDTIPYVQMKSIELIDPADIPLNNLGIFGHMDPDRKLYNEFIDYFYRGEVKELDFIQWLRTRALELILNLKHTIYFKEYPCSKIDNMIEIGKIEVDEKEIDAIKGEGIYKVNVNHPIAYTLSNSDDPIDLVDSDFCTDETQKSYFMSNKCRYIFPTQAKQIIENSNYSHMIEEGFHSPNYYIDLLYEYGFFIEMGFNMEFLNIEPLNSKMSKGQLFGIHYLMIKKRGEFGW